MCFLFLCFFGFFLFPQFTAELTPVAHLHNSLMKSFIVLELLVMWLLLLFVSVSLESALTDVFCFISFSFNFYCIYSSVAFRHLFIIYFSPEFFFFFLHRGRCGNFRCFICHFNLIFYLAFPSFLLSATHFLNRNNYFGSSWFGPYIFLVRICCRSLFICTASSSLHSLISFDMISFIVPIEFLFLLL